MHRATEYIVHGMCVDGNGNRRKPGSEASVGCNEVRTWGSSGSCQPRSGTPTPGGRILWSFWELVSALWSILNKDTNSLQCSLYSLLGACVMSSVAPADGERKCFLLLRKPSPGVSNRDWVLSDPHKYALSVGSDDRTYPLRILISLSRYMPVTFTHIRTQNINYL